MQIKWKENVREHMDVNVKNEVTYLTYPAFEELSGFYHGFSTRLGGVSEGIYASMNLSFTRGDDEACVMENYRRIAAAIGFSADTAVCGDQTHTARVRVVTEEDAGKGVICEKDYHDVDGLVTNAPGLTLTTFYADCVPLFFIDPVHKAIGLSHSGWRGTVSRIGAETLRVMKKEFGTSPKDVYAAIGPSICQDCYEVSEDVAFRFYEEFPAYREDISLLYQKENGKYQLNLWRANEIVLTEAGIQKQQLAFPGICTCCNPEFLFSHRASQGKRGNLAAFLGIKKLCS